jgi:hypothetical protein
VSELDPGTKLAQPILIGRHRRDGDVNAQQLGRPPYDLGICQRIRGRDEEQSAPVLRQRPEAASKTLLDPAWRGAGGPGRKSGQLRGAQATGKLD